MGHIQGGGILQYFERDTGITSISINTEYNTAVFSIDTPGPEILQNTVRYCKYCVNTCNTGCDYCIILRSTQLSIVARIPQIFAHGGWCVCYVCPAPLSDTGGGRPLRTLLAKPWMAPQRWLWQYFE